MDVIKNWHNKYKNEVKCSDNVITLSGEISPDDWLSYGNINAQTVRNMVKDIEGDITIRLNSPGGSAFEGIEIYNELKSLPNKVTVEVTALAASAATFICMAADEVLMCTGSQMMIHNAWTVAAGNAYDLLKVVDDLEKIDNSIKEIYSEKTGIPVDELSALMEEEKLWNADEVIEKGFADGKREKERVIENRIDPNNLVLSDEILEAIADKVMNKTNKNDSLNQKEDGSNFVQKNKLQKLFGGK